jgi:hypothetical protein
LGESLIAVAISVLVKSNVIVGSGSRTSSAHLIGTRLFPTAIVDSNDISGSANLLGSSIGDFVAPFVGTGAEDISAGLSGSQISSGATTGIIAGSLIALIVVAVIVVCLVRRGFGGMCDEPTGEYSHGNGATEAETEDQWAGEATELYVSEHGAIDDEEGKRAPEVWMSAGEEGSVR